MHALPGRVVKDILNPFANRSAEQSATKLRWSKEFVEMREYLVDSIRSTSSDDAEAAEG